MENSNVFLKHILKEEETGVHSGRYPRPGDVEAICGGPPCQGFSGANRFSKTSLISHQNNTCVPNFLSIVDKFYPKFVLMENVSNMLNFADSTENNEGGKRKMKYIYSIVLQCLIDRGYQVTTYVLQAGCYGVPQSRRRCFTVAVREGCHLPMPPTPTHCFDAISEKKVVKLEDKEVSFICVFVIFVVINRNKYTKYIIYIKGTYCIFY